MLLLLSPSEAQRKIANRVREKRLIMTLIQEGLAQRSEVLLATLRKFEQIRIISLASFLKLLRVVGGLEQVTDCLKPFTPNFRSFDEAIKQEGIPGRKRGHKK